MESDDHIAFLPTPMARTVGSHTPATSGAIGSPRRVSGVVPNVHGGRLSVLGDRSGRRTPARPPSGWRRGRLGWSTTGTSRPTGQPPRNRVEQQAAWSLL